MMQPYISHSLPLSELDFRRLFALAGKANAALARYDGLLQSVPNPAVLLSPLTTQEAVLSSKIEGTQATLDEVLEHEAGLLKEGEKYQDIQEISNYRQALHDGRTYLQNYPIRLGFVRQLHQTLMNSVCGHDKTPGEFRRAKLDWQDGVHDRASLFCSAQPVSFARLFGTAPRALLQLLKSHIIKWRLEWLD